MSVDLADLLANFPDLIPEALSRDKGATAYRLRLPEFPWGRQFAWAELRLPRAFPDNAIARIVLSPDAVLRLPHVDQTGALCIDGDPGPSFGHSAEDRILLLLYAFRERFLEPWMAGQLDGNFQQEAQNYWSIEVNRARSPHDPVRLVWTVDACPERATVLEGILLLPSRIVVAASDDLPIVNRTIVSMGDEAKQQIRVSIADIPISRPFTPSTWPRSTSDVERILKGRLRPEQYAQFMQPLRQRRNGKHRILLLRNTMGGFAYLLPGGPPTVVDSGKHKKAYPSLCKALPLSVTRHDVSWTVGRDQHPEVAERQLQHVLVLGAGALGSPVVDHLAKAGVGTITLVDDDLFLSANIGRHLLGAESIGQPKAEAVAARVNLAHPASTVTAQRMTAENWLQNNTLEKIDLVLDMTGEQDVRWSVDLARRRHPCPLVIGWMEPFVAAAHVCLLSAETPWMQDTGDSMRNLEAVTWPADVIHQEPGCSSRFQSYTASAAAHAVALVAENALKLLDKPDQASQVISWVRGQSFLDKHWPGLALREWARSAEAHDGLVMERAFE